MLIRFWYHVKYPKAELYPHLLSHVLAVGFMENTGKQACVFSLVLVEMVVAFGRSSEDRFDSLGSHSGWVSVLRICRSGLLLSQLRGGETHTRYRCSGDICTATP